MGFYTTPTFSVQLDEENTVVVRRPTVGERNKAFARAEANARGNNIGFALVLQQELLKAAVVSWSGPGFEGREPSEENIDALPPDVADRIMDEAAQFMEGLTLAEKKASGRPAKKRSSTAAQRAK